METEAITSAAVEEALQRILQSSRFASSPNLRNFLQYVVQQKLSGNEADLKAYTIAVDALGKPESFDPQQDPVVRVLAGRLRGALLEYYSEDGAQDPVRIDVPTGGYRPVFSAGYVPLIEEQSTEVPDLVRPSSSKTRPVWLRAALLVAAICVAALAYYLFQPRETQSQSQAISVLILTNSQSNPDQPGARRSANLLRQLGAALSRNETLAINYPRPNGDSGSTNTDKTDFALAGTAGKSGNEERFLVELTDSQTGALVWARTYPTGDGSDQSLPDSMIGKITRELNTELFGASVKILANRDPDSLTAQQLFVLATWVPGPAKNTLDWEKERIQLARLAIRKSPDYGPAYSVMADKLSYLAAVDGPSDTDDARTEAETSRRRALELSPGDAVTLFNVAQSQWHSGHVKDAVVTMRRVLELDPNHGLAGFFSRVIPFTCAEAPDDVLAAALAFDKSLNPDNPVRWVTLTWLGWLHLNRDEYDLALAAEKRAAQIFQIPYTVMRHAAILNILGRTREAASLIESQKKNWPNIDPAHFANVTMPRLCRDFPGETKMIDFYRRLAEATTFGLK